VERYGGCRSDEPRLRAVLEVGIGHRAVSGRDGIVSRGREYIAADFDRSLESTRKPKVGHTFGTQRGRFSVITLTIHVLVAGITGAVVGLCLQRIGAAAFSRFGAPDTKDLAAIAGIRIAAIFGIAVALIFSSSHAYYSEAKKNVLDEVRLVGTLYLIAKNLPDTGELQDLRAKLINYAQASARDLEQPQTANESAAATNQLLLSICMGLAPRRGETASTNWLRAQVQTSCDRLIELRGKTRVRMIVSNTEAPFWIFFWLSSMFLAVLFGVFERRPLNYVFAILFYFTAGATALLIFWMSNPYYGPSRISSTPFLQLIAKIEGSSSAAPVR
jgi:hypothetical protein